MSAKKPILEILDKDWNRLALTKDVIEASVTEELGSADGKATVAIPINSSAAAYLPDAELNDVQAVRFRLWDSSTGALEFAGHVDNRSVSIGDDTITFGGLQRGVSLADTNMLQRDFLGWPLPTLFTELLRNNIARAPFGTVLPDEEKTATPAINAISGQPLEGAYWSIPYDGARPIVFSSVVGITVDLGAVKSATAIRIIPPWWDNKYYAWHTYYSNDNETWTEYTPACKTNNQPLTDRGWFSGGFDIEARYWRVEFYQSSDGYPRLAQIMVYEDVATVGSDTTYAVPWIENNDSGLVTQYAVGWEIARRNGSFGNGKADDTYITKVHPGSAAQHRFRGTSEGVYFSQDESAVADIHLDDVFQERITIPSGNQTLGWSTTGLSLGEHTLRVTQVSGTPQIDYFSGEYASSWRTIEEDDRSIAYMGDWKTRYLDNFYNQAEKWTRTSGSEAAFEFYGDRFELIGAKSTQRGIFEWFLDGASQGNVDCYNATQQFQQALITWSGSYGAHTIRVKHTGTKNASATDHIVGIDRIQGSWAHNLYLRSAYDTNLSLLGRLSEMTNSFLRLNYDGTVDLLGAIGSDTGEILRVGSNHGGTITGGTIEGSFDEQVSAVLALGKGSDNNALRVFVQDRDAVDRIGVKVAKLESRDQVDAYLLVRMAWQQLQEQKIPKRRYNIDYDPADVLVSTVANDLAQSILDRGPIAYWPLDDLSDESGNEDHLSAVGSPTATDGLVPVEPDGAYEFPGSDSHYLQSPTLGALGTAFTLMGWIAPGSSSSGVFISGGASRPYIRHLNDDITFAFTNSGGTQTTFSTTGDAAAAGESVFVVATHDGSTARIYINGVEAATTAVASQAPGALSFRVGRWGSSSLPFDGTVDEVAIFDGALTPPQIAHLYSEAAVLRQEQRLVPVAGDVNVGDTARLVAPEANLTGDTYRMVERVRTWGADGFVVSAGFANKRDKLSNLLTRATRDLSLTTNTPQGFRNVTQYGGSTENFSAEVSGSTFRSAEVDIFIDQDAIILESSLRMKIGKYRSYERDTTSGGGSTSGASSSSTTSSDGTTSTTSSDHRHLMFAWQSNSTGGTEREYEAETLSGGGSTVNAYIKTGGAAGLFTNTADGAHNHTISHSHGMSHTHSTPAHVHTQNYDIYEEGSFPGAVSVLVDGVNVDSLIGGPFTASTSQTTFEANLNDVISVPGWHTLRFVAASGKGRITPYVLVKSLQLQ